jgi:hypothetical protein
MSRHPACPDCGEPLTRPHPLGTHLPGCSRPNFVRPAALTEPRPRRTVHPIRVWARANGYPIAAMGCIPRHIRDAYQEAKA